MASWITPDDEASERRQLDGIEVDPLKLESLGADPVLLGTDVVEKARVLLMADLYRAGATTRSLSAWYQIPQRTLYDRLKRLQAVPKDPAFDDRYARRLKEVVATKPKTLVDVIRAMQIKTGTRSDQAETLYRAGPRRRSGETALGERKSRAKEREA